MPTADPLPIHSPCRSLAPRPKGLQRLLKLLPSWSDPIGHLYLYLNQPVAFPCSRRPSICDAAPLVGGEASSARTCRRSCFDVFGSLCSQSCKSAVLALALLTSAAPSSTLTAPRQAITRQQMTSTPPKDDKWSAEKYNTNASFVYSAAYTNAVVNMLQPQANVGDLNARSLPTTDLPCLAQDRILDLGCGSGELTMELAPRVHSILGVDSSKDLLDKFRRNIAAAPSADGDKVTLIEHDGQELASLPAEHQGAFDAVFSSAAVHCRSPSLSSAPSAFADPLTRQG